MSSSCDHLRLLFIMILVPLSMHACTARPLNMVLGIYLAPVKSRGVRDMNQIKPQESLTVMEVKEATSAGQEIIVPSSSHDLDLAKASETDQGSKRMMLGKAARDSEEMVDDSKENEAVEDVDVMDYAQPHKKPPIHNEEKN